MKKILFGLAIVTYIPLHSMKKPVHSMNKPAPTHDECLQFLHAIHRVTINDTIKELEDPAANAFTKQEHANALLSHGLTGLSNVARYPSDKDQAFTDFYLNVLQKGLQEGGSIANDAEVPTVAKALIAKVCTQKKSAQSSLEAQD